MKRAIMLFFSLLCFAWAEGNSEMGRTVYKHIFKPELGYIGDDFVSKYKAKEWQELFANDGEQFKKVFGGISQKLDDFYKTDEFKAMLPHLKAFAVEFAADSGYSPHCHDIDEEKK